MSAGASGGSTYSGTGGDAEAHASSTRTSADPGDLGVASAAADATAGSGGTVDFSLTGHGGNAHALATATSAYGNGVTAQAIATGGDGVTLSSAQVGGSALAEATVTSSRQGPGLVSALARALGGRSFAPGSDVTVTQPTGLAHAIATANADASAVQFGVVTADGFAIGAGATTAESHVATNFNAITGLHSSITGASPGFDPLHSLAQTNYLNVEVEQVRSILSTDAGAAYVNGIGLTSNWMNNNANVLGAFAQGGKTVADGLFTAKSSLEDWSASVEVDLATHFFEPGKSVKLGFLDPELPSLGLDVLSIHISVNDTPVTDMTFTNAADALAALDDEVVILPASLFASNLIAAIRVSMDYQSTSPSGGFLSNFVVIAPVPEPALAALIGLGVALAALTRARAARGARCSSSICTSCSSTIRSHCAWSRWSTFSCRLAISSSAFRFTRKSWSACARSRAPRRFCAIMMIGACRAAMQESTRFRRMYG